MKRAVEQVHHRQHQREAVLSQVHLALAVATEQPDDHVRRPVEHCAFLQRRLRLSALAHANAMRAERVRGRVKRSSSAEGKVYSLPRDDAS